MPRSPSVALRWLGLVVLVAGCGSSRPSENQVQLLDFANRYTASWCRHQADSVAAFYSPQGSLTINGGTPAVGRAAIAKDAQGFMTAFPDMLVFFDSLHTSGSTVQYHWTLKGTNTGPGGTGRPVKISGYEEWTIGKDGLIARSLGHYDQEDYQRQLQGS